MKNIILITITNFVQKVINIYICIHNICHEEVPMYTVEYDYMCKISTQLFQTHDNINTKVISPGQNRLWS